MIIICTIRIITNFFACALFDLRNVINRNFCFVFGLSSLNIDPEYQKTLIIPRPGSACPMNIPSTSGNTAVNWPFASLNGQVRNVRFLGKKHKLKKKNPLKNEMSFF